MKGAISVAMIDQAETTLGRKIGTTMNLGTERYGQRRIIWKTGTWWWRSADLRAGAAVRAATLIAALMALAGPVCSANAQPVVLKCRLQDGRAAVDLAVDIKNKTMRWGVKNYSIVRVSSKFITAYEERLGEVGGEVWVMHRKTGQYWRAIVRQFCLDDGCKRRSLDSGVSRGRCIRLKF